MEYKLKEIHPTKTIEAVVWMQHEINILQEEIIGDNPQGGEKFRNLQKSLFGITQVKTWSNKANNIDKN